MKDLKKEIRNRLWKFTSNHYGKIAVEWGLLMSEINKLLIEEREKTLEEVEILNGFKLEDWIRDTKIWIQDKDWGIIFSAIKRINTKITKRGK